MLPAPQMPPPFCVQRDLPLKDRTNPSLKTAETLIEGQASPNHGTALPNSLLAFNIS
jgi:hypothetical protein